jgi:outer membrane protein assembly complex protein YaeT
VELLRGQLASEGFYNASVDTETNGHSDTQQIDITFAVRPGTRARIGEVRLTGKADLSVQQARHIAKWSPEDHFTRRSVEQGIEHLQRYYRRTDHWMASVRLTERDYTPHVNRVNLVVDLDPGPRVDVVLSGAKLSRKQLRRYVPIYEEGSIDHDLLAEGARNLRDYFQTRGYFEAGVDYQEHPEQNGVVVIEYEAALGESHHFVKLDITGNHYFDVATIRERMLMQPKTLQSHRGRFSQALLRNDVAAIQSLYRANGFVAAKVDSNIVDDYEGGRGDIAVALKIEEGPQTLVSNLKIIGNAAIPTETLVKQAASSPGQPFSETNVAGDRDQILSDYFSQGFADATLEWRSEPAAEPNRVNLEYTIREGERQFVNQVIVEGYQKTRDYIIERQMQIHSGQPLSQDLMIESQRRLYDLGIFAKVDMAIQNPEAQEQYRNVLFETLEARRWTVGFGGGAEIGRIGGDQSSLFAPAGTTGFSPRVSFELNRLNMFGRANTLTFQSRVSTLEKRGVLRYQAPQWRGKERLTLSYSTLVDQSNDIRTFSATRLEGSVQVQHKISKPTSLFYRYTYRRVTVDADTLKINPLLIPLFSQPVRVGLLGAGLFQDRRDDPVDAKRGMYNSVDIGLASYYTGSADSFGRLLMQNSTYHSLNRWLVLARTTQFGSLIPYGRPRSVTGVGPDGQPQTSFTREIPLPERFFAGGPYSDRGFPVNQAGPRDLITGFPVGGNGLLFNTVELRFPLRSQVLGGALFHDMGNVFSQTQNINFSVHQRSLDDFDYMVHAVGFGIRYRTPIGPVRLDFAYSINPPRFDGFNGTIKDLEAIGTGAIPPDRISEQHISHFQFHFSLGQTF